MMLSKLFRAEFVKITQHRWATGCLIGIFPMLALIFSCLVTLAVALVPESRESIREMPPLWTEGMVGVWNYPNNPFGRMFLLGFTAVLFAGEYQWNTWKNIVPRNRRIPILLIKFAAMSVFVVLAFVLMSIIWALGQGAWVWISGATYGPSISGEVLRDFLGDYLLQAVLAVANTLIAAACAALAAILTRSILGSIVIGIVFTFVDLLFIVGVEIIVAFIGLEEMRFITLLTPNFNFINITSLINSGTAAEISVNGDVYSNSLAVSGLMITVWIVGLMGAVLTIFNRQDITN